MASFVCKRKFNKRRESSTQDTSNDENLEEQRIANSEGGMGSWLSSGARD